MYKRLYLNKQVPPDRRSYNLVTHDIDGAQPRAWTHPEKPFFVRNDPETHLATQNDQYNVALHEQLLYREKEREPHWRSSKKTDFPDVQAKYSAIAKEKLINGREDFTDVKQAKQVFYARNLNTRDIEGTDVGSLNTKFMKNWQLAQEMKSLPQIKPKVDSNVRVPYGDGLNKEEYLPDHLKHAREMAGRNRNRLRMIQNVERNMGPAVSTAPDQNIDFRPVAGNDQYARDQMQYKPEVNQPYDQNYHDLQPQNAQQFPGLNNQFGDSRQLYDNNRAKGFDSGLQGRSGSIIDQRYGEKSAVGEGSDNLRTDKPQMDDTWKQAMEQMQRDQERVDRVRYDRDARFASESQPRVTFDNTDGENALSRSRGYINEPNQRSMGMSTAPSDDWKLGPEDAYRGYSRDPSPEDRTANRSPGPQYPEYQGKNSGYQPLPPRNGEIPTSKYQVEPQNGQASPQQVPEQFEDYRYPPKDIFRSSAEFHAYSKLSDEDKKMYMAAFLRGMKGKEFTLEDNKSDRLKHLNDFYADFLSEQYKRRLPFTKDEYNYRSTVNHLKRNGVL